MRTILIICLITLAAAIGVIRTLMSEPTRYGDFVGRAKVEVKAVIHQPEAFLGRDVLMEGEVREQCKTMGCHFFFVEDGKTLRVDLERLTGTAPMKEGHRVKVEGKIARFADGYMIEATAVQFL